MGKRFEGQIQTERIYRAGIALFSALFLILLLTLRLSGRQEKESNSDAMQGLLFLSEKKTALSQKLSDEALSVLLTFPG